MFVQVNVSLSSGETLSQSANDLASQILTAIGGNPEKDVVNVQIMDSGTAGQSTPTPMPPTPEPASESPPVP